MTVPDGPAMPHTRVVANPESGHRKRWLDWVVIGPIVVLALYVRLDTLTEQSLWEDELRQVGYYYEDSLKQVFYACATQGQPPLDYWIGYVLFKFNQSDTAARFNALSATGDPI